MLINDIGGKAILANRLFCLDEQIDSKIAEVDDLWARKEVCCPFCLDMLGVLSYHLEPSLHEYRFDPKSDLLGAPLIVQPLEGERYGSCYRILGEFRGPDGLASDFDCNGFSLGSFPHGYEAVARVVPAAFSATGEVTRLTVKRDYSITFNGLLGKVAKVGIECFDRLGDGREEIFVHQISTGIEDVVVFDTSVTPLSPSRTTVIDYRGIEMVALEAQTFTTDQELAGTVNGDAKLAHKRLPRISLILDGVVYCTYEIGFLDQLTVICNVATSNSDDTQVAPDESFEISAVAAITEGPSFPLLLDVKYYNYPLFGCFDGSCSS